MPGDGIGRHTPALSGEIVVRALSIDGALLPYVGDALNALANAYQWVEVGETVDDIVQACSDVVSSFYGDFMVGSIGHFLGSLPDGWLAMDGSTHDAGDYPELFLLLDEQFKDIGQDEFTLPDLGGLFALGSGNGFLLGDTAGAVDVTLALSEIPSHNHTYIQPIANVDLEAPGVPDILAAGVGPGTTTGDSGGGQAHENMPPYIALVVGVFSGRI